MPRRREVPQREVIPDPKFNSKLVTKFIKSIMSDGKRSTAEKIVYTSLDLVKEKTQDNPLEVFEKAMENVMPQVEVKSRRVGGSTYQVPTEIRQARRQALAMRWLIAYSKKRSEKSMAQKLASEFVDAFNNRGASVKKREDTHKMADANKAFAHYRW
ncbi:MAG: 30S ribosomal protein S7 [Desulfobacterales bacterium]|nr:30S ribosomal protein S7 [Desulfobacterales bacterium]